MNWHIGRMIAVEVLKESRAAHDKELVASLVQQASWTHCRELLPLPSKEAWSFYEQETIERRLSVREQIELLEVHRDGIVVAEYWTSLPPRDELENRIREIHREAQERIARRRESISDCVSRLSLTTSNQSVQPTAKSF